MSTRLESKIDDNGVVLVKIKGSTGTWGRPVVDDQGNFYRCISVAAEAMNVSQSTLRESIDGSAVVNNRVFDYATEEEVNRQVALSNEPKTKKVLVSPSKKMEVQTMPFTAVRWPDGTVTVRLTQGGTWTMTRQDAAELPEEVRSSCRWVG